MIPGCTTFGIALGNLFNLFVGQFAFPLQQAAAQRDPRLLPLFQAPGGHKFVQLRLLRGHWANFSLLSAGKE